jgi:hypothetical protein
MERPSRPEGPELTERWRKMERDLKGMLLGKQTPGSGNHHIKGDVTSPLFCAEAKYRWAWEEEGGFYLPLDLQWLEAIWHHAGRKTPLLALEWGNGERAVMMPHDLYLNLIGQDGTYDEHFPILDIPTRTYNVHWDWIEVPCRVKLSAIEVRDVWWIMIGWDEMREIAKGSQKSEAPKTRTLGRRRWG